MNHNPKQTILDLLAAGHEIAALADAEDNARKNEALARQAIGFFNAANALLTAFAEFHKELIEHPLFMAARKFSRRYS